MDNILSRMSQLEDMKGCAVHCKEDPIYVFSEIRQRSLSPNFHIHVSVSDFPRSVHLFSCCRMGRPIVGIFQ
jgi:hypothetical protein